MNPVSSVAVGGDFTLRTAFVGHVRSLSIQDSRQHEREIPAGQGFEQGRKAGYVGRFFVHVGSPVGCVFFTPSGTGNPSQSGSTILKG
jgi:hypothetical protein